MAVAQPVDIEPTDDAHADVLAVSVMGNATGGDCTGPISCVSISGSQDATNNGNCGDPTLLFVGAGCIAVSGTGNAGNSGYCGLSVLSASIECIAASGTGNASNGPSEPGGAAGCGWGVFAGTGVACLAISGTGRASNVGGCGVAEEGLAVGCIAVSGTGDAQNAGVCGLAALGAAVSCIAVSGAGDASNAGYYCGYSGIGSPAVGCIAVSGTGDASNVASTDCAPVEFVGVGAGCVALSATGNATNGATRTCTRPEYYAPYPPGIEVTCIAISAAGSASNHVAGGSCDGIARADPASLAVSVGCVAVSIAHLAGLP